MDGFRFIECEEEGMMSEGLGKKELRSNENVNVSSLWLDECARKGVRGRENGQKRYHE